MNHKRSHSAGKPAASLASLLVTLLALFGLGPVAAQANGGFEIVVADPRPTISDLESIPGQSYAASALLTDGSTSRSVTWNLVTQGTPFTLAPGPTREAFVRWDPSIPLTQPSYSVTIEAVDSTTTYSKTFTIYVSDGELTTQNTSLASSLGPAVGDTVYASAVERYLPTDLYNALGVSTLTGNLQPGEVLKGPNEYSYRITSVPNDESTLLDPQGMGLNTMLTAQEQDDWYEELGFIPASNYDFSWRAFVCVSGSDLSSPTGLRVEYTSLEDAFNGSAIDADDNADLRGMVLAKAAGDLPTATANGGFSSFITGQWDQVNREVPLAFSNVTGSCAVGSLAALEILDSNDNPVVSKDLTITQQLRVDVPFVGAQSIDVTNLTIGVTGVSFSVDFEAALWGLTTIEPAVVSSAPSPYSGPIVAQASDSVRGGDVVVRGSNLTGVTSVEVDGLVTGIFDATETEFRFALPVEVVGGIKDLVLVGNFGRLTVQDAFVVSALANAIDPGYWTKLQPDGKSVKFYAKNIIGEGKIQFWVNGTEVDWINAVDKSDAKLSFAKGFYYLVRTVELNPGKNRMEITLDGERVFFATYVLKP